MKKMTFAGRMQAYILMTVMFGVLTSTMVLGIDASNDIKKSIKPASVVEIHEISAPELAEVEEVSYE